MRSFALSRNFPLKKTTKIGKLEKRATDQRRELKHHSKVRRVCLCDPQSCIARGLKGQRHPQTQLPGAAGEPI